LDGIDGSLIYGSRLTHSGNEIAHHLLFTSQNKLFITGTVSNEWFGPALGSLELFVAEIDPLSGGLLQGFQSFGHKLYLCHFTLNFHFEIDSTSSEDEAFSLDFYEDQICFAGYRL